MKAGSEEAGSEGLSEGGGWGVQHPGWLPALAPEWKELPSR